MIISKTHFFLLLYQSGTSLTSTLETQQASILLKKASKLHMTLCQQYFRYNSLGIKLLTRLRLGLSHLHEHKFRHCFRDTLNPLCECGKDIESTVHFFLHCTNFLIPRQTLFQKIRNIDDSSLSQSETQLTQTLLYSSQTITLALTGLSLFQPWNT